MAREAGARKVIFAICAPPITHPHIYGIDLASPKELVASGKNRAQIAKAIGADDIIYQSIQDLSDACAEVSPPNGPKSFEIGVFCGNYVTSVPEGYFEHLAELYDGKGAVKNGALVGSSGPMNVPPANGAGQNDLDNREKHEGIDQEDINLHNVGND